MELVTTLRTWARVQPEAPAVTVGHSVTTWRRFWNRIERASARLEGEWGVAAGDVVAYLGQNGAEELILFFALLRLGAVFLPLNTRLAAPEWTAVLGDAGAVRIVHDAGSSEAARAAARELQLAHALVDELIAEPCAHRPEIRDWPGETPALLVYTSGTTGEPKGVLHTQGALLSNAVASILAHGFSRRDHVLAALPLFHVGGLCIQTVPALVAGGSVTLLPRFDANAWIEAVEGARPTWSLMVPATMAAVITHPGFEAADLSSLSGLMAGSSIVPVPLIEAFHARGVAVGQVYGATETGPVSVVLGVAEARAKPGYAGWPAPFTEIRLVDDRGAHVAPGAVGEIWVRSSHLAAGYFSRGTVTAFAGGWFRSGDLARADESGCLEVVGRVKDLIISGGENIYPAELENLLSTHPAVAEVAVVGVPDPVWGETPVAVLVLKPGAGAEPASIKALLCGRVARYKHPRALAFVPALPRNALGKVQKSAVRSALQDLALVSL